jgi:formamidopyrimidine-DNA glycosylase
MFELPECITLVEQMNSAVRSRVIKKGVLGNSPHKFVWYNRKHAEFEKLTKGKKIGKAIARGRWMFINLDPGYVLVIGECGGRIVYHRAGSSVPRKYHLYLTFDDGSFFTVTIQMWGALELYRKGDERKRQYIKDMRTTPIDDAFTFEYFNKLVAGLTERKSAKGLLTQDQLIPGLGNAIAQDILFTARLDPRHPVETLDKRQLRRLYNAIIKVVDRVIKKGGRYDEYDLNNNTGKYKRIMDKNAAGRPCQVCGTTVKKIQYLGGACYFCPQCQQ